MEVRPSHTPGRVEASAPQTATGGFVESEGESWYRISSFHRMPPFLMAIPGDGDLWMFLSSSGGLTAGRESPDGAVFPYRTVDELHRAQHDSGPITLLRAEGQLWQPFAGELRGDEPIERFLSKSLEGNRVVFEEIHHALGLRFRYQWASCDELGWIRSCTLQNLRSGARSLELLDGLRNILPFGAPLSLIQQAGNLVDAYKRNELLADSKLAIYSLSAGISDRPEALEMLRATVAWSCGLAEAKLHLDEAAVAAFREGHRLPAPARLDGARGSHLLSARLQMEAGQTLRWHVAVDAMRDQIQASALARDLRGNRLRGAAIDAAIRRATERLRANVASADGLQRTADEAACCHHFANVLFNNMRGGVFAQNHDVPSADFARFLRERNRRAAARHGEFVRALAPSTSVSTLLAKARESEDPTLERLALEYLPLHFGRRHGDPSRPWNRFSIHGRGRDGERELSYEGNWRDIFQNWESLAQSFPAFLPSMVAKFLNASTLDGHNPYRLTREGVDWEIAEPDQPWSHIGYWGDHQIVYLTRLLEAMDRFLPEAFDELLERRIFSSADVPYRIRPYAALVADPRHTIDFDYELQELVEQRTHAIGGDGRLLCDDAGEIVHLGLLEKLLVPALAKLSNLVPDGGIWMNTQRPEWNDANNALAGPGVSVVTLCALRRYLELLGQKLAPHHDRTFALCGAVADWMAEVEVVLGELEALCDGVALDPATRRHVLDRLGESFSRYRLRVYREGAAGESPTAVARVIALCERARRIVEWGIHRNRREDGLFHSYNLLALGPSSAQLERLDAMLEGQVAALSCGLLSAEEGVELLDELYASELYRADVRSFLLYPDRGIPGFLETNVLPEDEARAIPTLDRMLEAGDRELIARDAEGRLRFRGDLQNADDLARVLDALDDGAVEDRAAILALFERVFQHHRYLGRSGVMVGFEGQGCIYWHMVAKLLVATQEQFLRAQDAGATATTLAALADAYDRIRGGLGFAKAVDEYGAFPCDPYSHTPRSGGAQQPGMTGQVKEEILTRLGELGVRIEGGRLGFAPALLHEREFLDRPAVFEYVDVGGGPRSLALDEGTLAFTVCQTPVVYERSDGAFAIEVEGCDGRRSQIDGTVLDAATSRAIFSRDATVQALRVRIPAHQLRKASPR